MVHDDAEPGKHHLLRCQIPPTDILGRIRNLHDDVMHDRGVTRTNLYRRYPGVLFERTRNKKGLDLWRTFFASFYK